MWQHYSTEENKDAFIDPGIVRAVLPSRYGDTYALLVLDGGVKVHVRGGGPAEFRRSLLPAADFHTPVDASVPETSTSTT
jgi:hypothetical protein